MTRIVNYFYNFNFQCLYKKTSQLVTLVALACIYRLVTRPPALKKRETPAEVYRKSCLSHPVREKKPSPKSVRFPESCPRANVFLSRLFPEGVPEGNLPAFNQIFREIEDPDWVVTTINKLACNPNTKIKFLRLFAYYNKPKDIMTIARQSLSQPAAVLFNDQNRVNLITGICRQQL